MKRPGSKRRIQQRSSPATEGTAASEQFVDEAQKQLKVDYQEWYARFKRRNIRKFELFRSYILAYHDGKIKADRLLKFMDKIHRKSGSHQHDNLFTVSLLSDIRKVDVALLNKVFDEKKQEWIKGQ